MTKYQKCPTCGSDVEVQGDVTKSFVPLERIDEGELGKMINDYMVCETEEKEDGHTIKAQVLDISIVELSRAINQRFGKERIRVPEEKDESKGNGMMCKCEAWSALECGCGADWTDYKLYNAAIAEFKRLNGIE